MREILFRAKSKNSGRWVYGDLITQKYKSRQGIHIYEKNDSFGYQFVRINKKTLGQYTGLADKNGTKIFEGDILELHDKTSNIHWTAIVEFGNPNAEYTWGWQLKLLNILEPTGTKQAYWNKDILLWVELEVVQVSCEVIGNLHNNPELLEKVGD